MLITVEEPGTGEVILHALTDGYGRVTSSSGPMKEWVDYMIATFDELTEAQITSKFAQRSTVTTSELEHLPAIVAPTPQRFDLKAIGNPKRKPVKKDEHSTVDRDDIEGKFSDIAKMDEDERNVFGWAYVTHDVEGNVVIDKSGEFVDDPKELEAAAYDYVINKRIGGDSHKTNDDGSPTQIGTMIESVVFTPDKIAKMGIPAGVLPTAWWLGIHVTDDEVWQQVKKGERPAFSIQGSGVRKAV